MSVLTIIQIKRVAKFLNTSCKRIPNNSACPKLSQWLDILSRELGYKDWNVTSSCLKKAPVLTSVQSEWLYSHRTFWGFARVLVAGEKATHRLIYSENHESMRLIVATKLAKKIRERIDHEKLSHRFQYSQPDVRLGDGKIAPAAKNRAEGNPIVIKSDGQEVVIHLWWLSESYQVPENMPAWAKHSPAHVVYFDGEGDLPLHAYAEDELNDSLTDLFLRHLTGKEPGRRTCLYLPRWNASPEALSPMLVTEGNPQGTRMSLPSGGDWSEKRSTVDAYNSERGLSSLDCETIAARYEAAEKFRNEDDYVDYSGIFED